MTTVTDLRLICPHLHPVSLKDDRTMGQMTGQ